MSGSPLWRPDPARAEATHLARFLHHVGQPGYAELHRWSVEQPSEFWAAVWDQCGVVGRRGVEVVVPDDDMPATRFFPDAHLNVAENLLAGWAGDEPAIISHDETGHREECSGSELVRDVAALAAALEELGVGPGDRVAAWLPNRPEAVITMLAAASLGAVFSSCSPDFGTLGVLDRFGQIEPVVLVAAAGYHYNGAAIDCRPRLAEIRAGLPSVRTTVVVPARSASPDDASAPIAPPDGTVAWDDLLDPHRDRAALRFRALPFDHPWYVLYSSGTTGPPKCIVHRAGGVLLMHLKEHQLHCDVHRGDRVLYYTTTGWMMWNWLASALASGATIVLYDGSPFVPHADHLFDLVDEEGISLLGVSAKLIDSLAKAGREPRPHPRVAQPAHDLLHRLAAVPRGLPLRLRAREGRRPPGVDLGRYGPLRQPGRRRSHRPGLRGRDPTTDARHGDRRLVRGRFDPAGRRGRRRAGLHRAVPVDAARLLG